MEEILQTEPTEYSQDDGNSQNQLDNKENQSVDILNLRPRIRHLLARHRIHTIADLENGFDKLSEINGMGDILISEIRSALEMISVKVPNVEENQSQKIDVEQTPDINLEGSSTEFLSSWFTRIPSGIDLDQVTIDELKLSTRTHNSILRGGVSTLGDLVEIQKFKKDLKFANFGPVSAQELSQKLEFWVSKPKHISFEPPSQKLYEHDKVEEAENGKSIELSTQRMFEFEKVEQATPGESLDNLLASIKKDYVFILSSLYGLHSKDHMTLQEIASIQGVTRERIRQKKDAAIRRLIKYIHLQNPFPLAALLQDLIQQHHGCVSSKRLANDLDLHLTKTNYLSTGVLELLTEIGLSNFKPQLTYLPKLEVWLSSEIDSDQAIITYQAIMHEINGKQSAIAWTELYSSLQQYHDLLSLQEEFAFAVTLSLVDNGLVTQLKDGMYSGLRPKAGRDERIIETLRAIGDPAHFTKIAQVHNSMFPEKVMSDHSVQAVLFGNDKLFVRVGRGTYGLLEWGLISDGTIANTVWRIINNNKSPVLLGEIKNEVQKTWQVESNSIDAAIYTDSRFIKYPDGRIGLTEQGKAIKKVDKRSDTNRLKRIVETLRFIGRPTNYRDITTRHNEYFPDTLLTKTAVYNTLVHKQYGFVRVGEGIFGLAEWGLEPITDQDSTITRLIDVLYAVSKPIHYKEIHCVHNQLYPKSQISINTVYFILQKNPNRFNKLGKGIYGLKEWGSVESEITRVDSKDELRKILLQAGKPLPYIVIHSEYNRLHPSHNISANRINRILSKGPEYFIKVGSGLYGLKEWGIELSEIDQSPTHERLRKILLQKSKYIHYTELQKEHNRLYPEKAISKNTVYGILRKYQNIFSKYGDGFFGLAEW